MIRPAAHVPPSSTRASGNSSAPKPRAAATCGAISSRSATVALRHPTTNGSDTSCTFEKTRGSRGTSTPISTNKPPLRYSANPVNPPTSTTRTDAFSNGSINEYASHCESLCSGTKRSTGRSPRSPGWGQQSPSGTPSSVGRFGQIDPSPSRRTSRIVAAGSRPPESEARRTNASNNPPKHNKTTQANRTRHTNTTKPNRFNNAARPWAPCKGLSEEDRNARAIACPSTRQSAAAAARKGSRGSYESTPCANQRRLASAWPSEREATRPSAPGSRYRHPVPAPASNNTDVMARSNSARAASAELSQLRLQAISLQRSRPPNTK